MKRGVHETKRDVRFDNGETITYTNVTHVDNSGTWLRIWCDQGYVLLNSKRILSHTIPNGEEVF